MSAPTQSEQAPLLELCARCNRTIVLFMLIGGKPTCAKCWREAGCPWPKN